jgi:hypothetical protein
MDAQLKNALAEGLVDALGFVAGAMTGALLARALGFDFLGEQGWGGSSIAGIVLVGLGAGLGRGLARKLLRRAPVAPPAPAGSGTVAVKTPSNGKKRR